MENTETWKKTDVN